MLDGQVLADDTFDCVFDADERWVIGVQLAPAHVAPDWPDGNPQQVHLDLHIDNPATAHAKAIALRGPVSASSRRRDRQRRAPGLRRPCRPPVLPRLGTSRRRHGPTDLAGPSPGVEDRWLLGASQGRPACGTGTGWTSTTPSDAPRRSSGWPRCTGCGRHAPSMHEKQPRSATTVSSTSPPSATRAQRFPGTLAYQIAPSASAQMPSGAEPGPRSAHTRRSIRSPGQ